MNEQTFRAAYSNQWITMGIKLANHLRLVTVLALRKLAFMRPADPLLSCTPVYTTDASTMATNTQGRMGPSAHKDHCRSR